jgi:hypothetical protein
VAKEITRDDDILKPKDVNQLRIGSVTEFPDDPLPQPRFDFRLLPLPIKHFRFSFDVIRSKN